MKKLMMLTVLMALMHVGFAQTAPGEVKKSHKKAHMMKMKEKLNLSDAQVAQWKSIHQKYASDIKTARQNQDREQGKAIRTQMRTELASTLNHAQKQQFKAMKRRHRLHKKN